MTFMSLPFAIFLCFVILQCVKKEKFSTISFLSVCVVILAFMWHPAMIGFIKSGLVQILNTKIIDLGKRLDSAYNAIADFQEDMEIQKKAINEQQQRILLQQSKIDTTQNDLNEALEKIQLQQKQLDSFDAQIKELYAGQKSESFRFSDNEKFAFINMGERNTVVYFELEEIPIKNSITIQYYVYLQPSSAYLTKNNVVLFIWNGSTEELKTKYFRISYFPDKNNKDKHYDLRRSGENVYIDNVSVTDFIKSQPGPNILFFPNI